VKAKVRLQSQLQLYKITEVKTALSGSETWILRNSHKSRIQIADKKFRLGVAEYIQSPKQI